MRRLLPDSIAGWTILVLVLGLLLSQAVALVIFATNRHDTLAAVGGRLAADRVAAIVTLMEETPQEERRRVLRALDVPGLRVGWGWMPSVSGEAATGLAETIRDTVRERLGVETVRVAVGRIGDGFAPPWAGRQYLPRWEAVEPDGRGHRMMNGFAEGKVVRMSVRLNDGSWLNFAAPLDLAGPLWRPRFTFPIVLTLLVVGALSVWAVRRATGPFAAFANAAERLGVDVAAPPLPEKGPREVRRAAHAFNEMQTRLRRFIEDRTQMLAAVSHDLRTPITRMRLRAEFVEDETEREKMLADLAEMEAMIAATLSFARDDVTREPRRQVDVAALLQGLCDDAVAAGREASYDGPASLIVEVRPTALKRAFANLIDNAVRYGLRARVRMEHRHGEILVEVDDDGPGIPSEERERVFTPFYRLERSRSRETGGTGLGLAVARNVVRGHGGDVTLANREGGGGLTVTVTLPVAGTV